jgi:hypothetical protein
MWQKSNIIAAGTDQYLKTTRSIHFIISIACLHYYALQVYLTVHASIRIEHSSRPQRHWRPYDRRFHAALKLSSGPCRRWPTVPFCRLGPQYRHQRQE